MLAVATKVEVVLNYLRRYFWGEENKCVVMSNINGP